MYFDNYRGYFGKKIGYKAGIIMPVVLLIMSKALRVIV